jgi:N-dimethylarginine dimethylaminohydrolase
MERIMEFHVRSEFEPLRDVLLGTIRNFTLNTPINVTQKHYYATDPPKIERMIEQEERFIEALTRYNVTIHQLPVLNTSFTQFFVRDIATVIGDTLVICAMKEAIRQPETAALAQLLEGTRQPVLRTDTGFLEGGDILIDQSVLYVGLGERTGTAGVAFLEQHFGTTFEIVPLQLAATFLHLDVVVNLLGKGDALVYAPALDRATRKLLAQRYNFIEVTAEEQFALSTNVLSLTPETLIVDERNRRLNKLLAKRGYEVVPLSFDEIGKMGGSFRCGSCPLRRG